MRTAPSIAVLALLVAGGCGVQPDKYDDTVMGARSLKEQLVAAERQRDVAQGNLEELRGELAEARTLNDSLQTQVGALEQDLAEQAQQYDELLKRVSRLQFGPLPAGLETALEDLAAAYPELLAFDADRGILRFSSDFTFDLGSAELKPDAAATISTLADILNSREAAAFEIRLIGHTDNVPVEKPSTRRRHPTNVHLSVHRAISVRDALVDAGVEPVRIMVAGYGEFRPIVPNGAKGAAGNRRVELLLTPRRTAAAKPAAPQQTAAPPVDEPMK